MNGNGRTARILSSLELMRYVRAPELISIEPAILRSQDDYFRHIREALGPSFSPDRHSTTEWIAWYVNLHAQCLEDGHRYREALVYDIGTVVGALERAGDPLEWGPVVALAGFGPHVYTRTIAAIYGRSQAWARALAAEMTRAGWLAPRGRTSGRYYVATERVLQLNLRTRELRERSLTTGTLGLLA
jgi:Fic family protein